jgi:hypothetical protein
VGLPRVRLTVRTLMRGVSLRRWEEDYSSLLPPGHTDFRGHLQSYDIGVRIVSFRCPDGWDGERALRHLTGHINQFTIYEQKPGEAALRRPVTYSDPAGFDEFRFIYYEETGRIYGMFANLDSEMEVHRSLVQRLREIAQKASAKDESQITVAIRVTSRHVDFTVEPHHTRPG